MEEAEITSSFLNPQEVIREAGIDEGMLVADFGAGSGFFTRAAARTVGESGRVWAVDAHRDILSHIKTLSEAEGLHNVDVMHGDVEAAGGSRLPAGEFDCVIAANILFSCEDKNKLVAEIFRVLKNGGRAIVIDWSGSFGGLGPHATSVISRGAAMDLFEKGGFVFLENVPAGAYHWGFIVRKQGA
jgi:ubiquinone/menaquinone biosynthesis C-methylase UbiE